MSTPDDPAVRHIRKRRRARVMATSAFDGGVSVTIRKQQWNDAKKRELESLLSEAKRRLTIANKLRPKVKKARSDWDKQLPLGKFLIGADKLVQRLSTYIVGSTEDALQSPCAPKSGLLVFAGQTGCGKTEILKRFLIRYLRSVDSPRKPLTW